MENDFRKTFDEFLMDNGLFEDVVRELRGQSNIGLRQYLNRYNGDPEDVLLKAPFNWQEAGGNIWKVADEKWRKYYSALKDTIDSKEGLKEQE